jgi:hypothetical protein
MVFGCPSPLPSVPAFHGSQPAHGQLCWGVTGKKKRMNDSIRKERMGIQRIAPPPELLEEVARVSGKRLEFIPKERLAAPAMIQMARRAYTSPLRFYRATRDEVLVHRIVHLCGHLLRIFRPYRSGVRASTLIWKPRRRPSGRSGPRSRPWHRRRSAADPPRPSTAGTAGRPAAEPPAPQSNDREMDRCPVPGPAAPAA